MISGSAVMNQSADQNQNGPDRPPAAPPLTPGVRRGEARVGAEPGRGRGDKETWLVRLATLNTTSGSRLHVRTVDGGYVDIGEATGEARFARFESFIRPARPR